MSSLRTLAILLLAGGALAIVYGGFSYTQATHTADLGNLHLEVNEKHRVNVPLWAGLAAIVAGGLLLGRARGA